MKTPCLLAGLLFAFAVSPLYAGDNEDRIKKIVADVQTALDAQKTGTPPARGFRPDGAASLMGQLQGSMGLEGEIYRESALTQLAFLVDAGPVRQECLDLAATLRREREASEKSMVADIDAATDRAAAAVRAAKTAPELDPIVNELGKYHSDRGVMASSRPAMSALARAQATLNFVTQWQDYLSQLAAGDTGQAVQTLQSLSQNNVFLIPRSEILERIHGGRQPRQNTPSDAPVPSAQASPASAPVVSAGPPVIEIVAGIKTLDTLAPALDALDKISRNGEDARQPDVGMAMKFLSPLDQSYREFRAGQSTKVELNTPSLPSPGGHYDAASSDGRLPSVIQSTMLALRDQLLSLTLPRYLDLPASVTARPGEGPIDFLDRLKTEALAAGNYLGAARADEARTFLRSGGSQTGAESSQAAQFIIADRQDAARQFALAVASYERALATGTNLIPAKVIGDRLDAIKTAHSQEFQQGLDLYLTPPAPRGYPYMPYGPPYGPPGMMRRGGAPYGQPEPPPSLAVPAATPAASASPK